MQPVLLRSRAVFALLTLMALPAGALADCTQASPGGLTILCTATEGASHCDTPMVEFRFNVVRLVQGTGDAFRIPISRWNDDCSGESRRPTAVVSTVAKAVGASTEHLVSLTERDGTWMADGVTIERRGQTLKATTAGGTSLKVPRGTTITAIYWVPPSRVAVVELAQEDGEFRDVMHGVLRVGPARSLATEVK